MVSSRKIGVAIIVLFIADVLLAGYAPSLNIPTPGVSVAGSWAIPSLVTNATDYYQYWAMRGKLTSPLQPVLPVLDYSATNTVVQDFQQFENLLVDLFQHTGLLPSTDQAREQLLVSTVVQPFLETYSPNNMALAVWKQEVGSSINGQPAQGTLTVGSQKFTSYDQFRNAVTSSNSFAQLVALKYGWGWTQACPSDLNCPSGTLAFIPAGRYWTMDTLALLIQVQAQQGMSQQQVVQWLLDHGYNPNLVYNSMVLADSKEGTKWNPDPSRGLDAAVYGNRPLIIDQGVSQPSIIVGADGTIWGMVGLQQQTGITAAASNTFVENGCGFASSNCDAFANFWAAVATNGGWGAVQGGASPRIILPEQFVTELGNVGIQAGVNNPQGFDSYTLGSAIANNVVNTWDKIVYSNYPISEDPTVCQMGCISPETWAQTLSNTKLFQQQEQAWMAKYGHPILQGQPPLESGILPGYGQGAALPTPLDSEMNAILTGAPGFEASTLATPSKAQYDNAGKCISGCLNAWAKAFYDPDNPGSFTKWFDDYGWSLTIPGEVIDPSCSSQLCADNPLGPVTHYLMANYFNNIMSAMLDPTVKAELAKIGIVDKASTLKWFDKQIQIGNQLHQGEITAEDAAAVASLGQLIIDVVWAFHVNLDKTYPGTTNPDPNSFGTVFDMPWGDYRYVTLTNKYGVQTSQPVPCGESCGTGTFQAWYENPGSYSSALHQALRSVLIGLVPLGDKMFIDQGWHDLGVAAAKYAVDQCKGKTCSLENYQNYIIEYIHTKCPSCNISDEPTVESYRNIEAERHNVNVPQATDTGSPFDRSNVCIGAACHGDPVREFMSLVNINGPGLGVIPNVSVWNYAAVSWIWLVMLAVAVFLVFKERELRIRH